MGWGLGWWEIEFQLWLGLPELEGLPGLGGGGGWVLGVPGLEDLHKMGGGGGGGVLEWGEGRIYCVGRGHLG